MVICYLDCVIAEGKVFFCKV